MLRFGLVTIPVEAVNAHSTTEGSTHFHQLHEPCHSRIRYVKTCPIHGEVTKDEIISGYEYARDHYVEIEPDELDALRTEREKAFNIDNFVEPGEVDPMYFDGRMYYLIPDGEGAREPYAVFLEGLKRKNRCGVGQIVFSGKEQAALVRPHNGILVMALLNYENEMRTPDDVMGKLPTYHKTDKTIRLVEQLIETWGKEKFDFSEYTDVYETKVRELIDAKVEGHEIVAPEEEDEPEVVNLMDAIRKSLKSNGSKASGTKPTSRRKPKSRAASKRRTRKAS
jgi:DNA end-binding protein Ku